MAAQIYNDKATTDEQDQSFRLLDLPPEIWSHIRKLAIVDERPKIIKKVCMDHGVLSGEECMQPALSRTCRAIRDDSLEHFYGNNIFYGWAHYCSRKQMIIWLAALGSVNRSHLKRCYFRSHSTDREHWVLKEKFKFYVEVVDGENEDVKAIRGVRGADYLNDLQPNQVWRLVFQ